MRMNDNHINNDSYFLIHIPAQFQKPTKTKNKNSFDFSKTPTVTKECKSEVENEDILLYEDIIKFDYIFHVALEREMLKLAIKESEVKSLERFISYICSNCYVSIFKWR